MGLNGTGVHPVRLDTGVRSETVHIGDPIGCVLAHLEVLIDQSVDTRLHQEAALHHGTTVDVKKGQLVGAEQELSVGFDGHLLVGSHCTVAESLDFFHVLATRKDHAEKLTKSLVKLDHFDAHLG